MTSLEISITSDFLGDIGFLQMLQKAAQIEPDKDIIAMMKRLAPKFDLAKSPLPQKYTPPRWIGYWVEKDMLNVSDGRIKVRMPCEKAWTALVNMIRSHYYSGSKGSLPFMKATVGMPSHALLHDLESERLYIESMEQAEAVLVGQTYRTRTR